MNDAWVAMNSGLVAFRTPTPLDSTLHSPGLRTTWQCKQLSNTGAASKREIRRRNPLPQRKRGPRRLRRNPRRRKKRPPPPKKRPPPPTKRPPPPTKRPPPPSKVLPPPSPSPAPIPPPAPVDPNLPPGKGKYGEVLGLSWKFYEAQKSGAIPPGYPIPWVSTSLLTDTVVGGWYGKF